MKKFLSSFLVLSFVFSIFALSTPETAKASGYCYSDPIDQNNGKTVGDTRVLYGTKSQGACHIEYYHMAKPGAGSAIVDGVSKSQLSAKLTITEMASIANETIGLAGGGVYTSDGRYKAEFFNIRMNQYLRVIFWKNSNTNNVITMYPYK